MKFAPKELCKKLEGMGCKSESDFYYSRYEPQMTEPFYKDSRTEHIARLFYAFTIEDFIGTHEQAKENARIVWGLQWPETYMSCRHDMIDSADWVKYLEETMGESK